MPIVVGGGGGGLLLVVLYVAFQLLGGSLGSSSGTGSTTAPPVGSSASDAYQGREVPVTSAAQQCQTGADANARTDCRIVGVVNSVQSYWSSELPRRGVRYSPANTVLYSRQLQGGCGIAQSAEGPFYCPNDKKVYLDLSFFDELRTRFGAQGGPFAQAYVVAHEYGHHIQDVMGILQASNRANVQGPRGHVRADRAAGRLSGRYLGQPRGPDR